MTYFFLRGLQGEADQNKDKRIDLGELKEYLSPRVIEQARKDNREQEPQLNWSGSKEWEGVPLAVMR